MSPGRFRAWTSRAVLCGLFVFAPLGPVAPVAPVAMAQPPASSLTYSAVDRATVRVFAVTGVASLQYRTQSGRMRVIAVPDVGHGSGVLVSADGLVVTAHHVVANAQMLAVRVPGEPRAFPATVVWSDPQRDFAVIALDGRFDAVTLPDPSPALRVRQTVNAIGYPLDPRREEAQSSQGIIAGTLADGTLQLSISVNPGNSGGPLIDDREQVIGIVIARGDPNRGVQGIGFAAPLEPIRDALAQLASAPNMVATARARAREAGAHDVQVAEMVSTLVRLGAVGLLEEAATVVDNSGRGELLDRLRELSRTTADPDVAALTAAYFWDAAAIVLEHGGGLLSPMEMAPSPMQQLVMELIWRAISLGHEAARRDPTILRRSSFVGFLVSLPVPPPPAHLRPPPPGQAPAPPAPALGGAPVMPRAPVDAERPAPPPEPAGPPAPPRWIVTQLAAGAPQAANEGNLEPGGILLDAAIDVGLAQMREESSTRVALAAGGGLVIGGWRGDALFAIAPEAAVALRAGRDWHFVGVIAWAPGMLVSDGDTSLCVASYRIALGVGKGSLAFGLGWRGMQPAEGYALHALNVFLGLGFR